MYNLHESFVVGANFLYMNVVFGVDVWLHGAVSAQHCNYARDVLQTVFFNVIKSILL